MSLPPKSLRLRQFDLIEYSNSWQQMKAFTDSRTRDTVDELWLLEHEPVFTFGQAGKPEHLLAANQIPVVKSDRGGQVTYHGPGQLIAYPLINLSRLGIGVRSFVEKIEQCLIDTLAEFGISAERKPGAPGVYVNSAKIAALGLRVRHGYTFHGMSLNVDMDLTPFQWINPCGYEGLAVAQITDLASSDTAPTIQQAGSVLVEKFCQQFGYTIIVDDTN